jgi:hypothetical protein
MPSVRLGFWLYLVNAWLIRVEARAAHNDFAAVFIPNRTIVAFVRSTNLAGERRVFHAEQSIHYAAGGQTFFDALEKFFCRALGLALFNHKKRTCTFLGSRYYWQVDKRQRRLL